MPAACRCQRWAVGRRGRPSRGGGGRPLPARALRRSRLRHLQLGGEQQGDRAACTGAVAGWWTGGRGVSIRPMQERLVWTKPEVRRVGPPCMGNPPEVSAPNTVCSPLRCCLVCRQKRCDGCKQQASEWRRKTMAVASKDVPAARAANTCVGVDFDKFRRLDAADKSLLRGGDGDKQAVYRALKCDGVASTSRRCGFQTCGGARRAGRRGP